MPTQYAVVSVAEPERHLHLMTTGAEAAMLAQRANNEARAAALSERYRVIPVTTPDDPEEPSWQQREQARFDSGQYTAVPWANEPWAIREHYAHVSTRDCRLLAYTANESDGGEDRQITVTPGRYLDRYYYDLSNDDIRRWCARWAIEHEGLTVQFATTESEIERVYRNGPTSCMSHPAREYSTAGYHPVRVYAAGDLAVAYIERDGYVSARCICWPERHIYGRIYDGADGKLQALLENQGFRPGGSNEDWNGARLLLRRIGSRHRIVLPYLDDPNHSVTVDLEAQILRLDNHGGVYGRSTDGSVSFAFPAQTVTTAPAAGQTSTAPVVIPRFTLANRWELRRLFITYVAPANPHRPGTPTYDNWAQFVGTEGLSLWDLWHYRHISPSHLNYRVRGGHIRVERREV